MRWFHANQPNQILSENPWLELPGTAVQTGWYIVEGRDGQRDSIEVERLDCEARLAMPNWFSPNGDGVNDRFHPQQANLVALYEIRIYDRWGREVYHSKNLEGWDGQSQGQSATNGTYYYRVVYRLEGSVQSTELRGALSLYR